MAVGVVTGGSTGTTASTGAGVVAGVASGLVAQADRAKAERSRAIGATILSVLDMVFSRNTVGGINPGRIKSPCIPIPSATSVLLG